MLTKEKIQELQHQAHEAIASELEEERILREPVSLVWLLRQLPAWKRWYLKRNQQRNYFRVTRIIPPGAEENHHRWIQRFQVCIQGKLHQQETIESATFDYFCSQPGWEKHDTTGMTYAILRPLPPAITAQPGNDY